MEKPAPFIIVIFGATGDLTAKKLAPALFALNFAKLLPKHFALLGVGRQPLSDYDFREKLRQSLINYARIRTTSAVVDEFVAHAYYQQLDYYMPLDYSLLRERLISLDEQCGNYGNYLFYLATPPELFAPIATLLATQRLHRPPLEAGWRRLVIEKPFGFDGKSAADLNTELLHFFDENQIFRIDHYLGKETVQNILAFRFANGIFEPLWNRHYVHHVEITAVEHIGIENRGAYYDRAGALRDMVQSHLLAMISVVAMEPPAIFDSEALRNEKVKVLQSLAPIQPENVAQQVIRGQYLASTIKGKHVVGYRQEEKVDPQSTTETFVAMKFFIDNWRWAGVPFYLRTGKRLPTRVTEVVIHFRPTPHHLFKEFSGSQNIENQLILRIQPDEGILLKFGMKVPGAGYAIKNVGMDFHYKDLSEVEIPEAYERLILDVLSGDNTLFARIDEVEASWRFIDPILNAWKENKKIPLYGYPAGTWGPKEARLLFDNPDEDWRYPCKNLSGDESYCEL